jgi:mevalonate kinase
MRLNLSFDSQFHAASEFSVEPAEAQPLIKDLLLSIAEDWESEGHSFRYPKGRLTIESTIPIGAGLGSSAALCVALTQWLAEPLSISADRVTEFATRLEHRFHGRSSGMDVAVIASREPISFVMGRGPKTIGVKKLPLFTFHDTGLRCRTSECVVRVEKFREDFPTLGMEVDEAMSAASRIAMEGLVLYDSGQTDRGIAQVQKAIMQARECFYAWELVPGEAKGLEDSLLKQGALAVKLTGAGGGGMVVALWPSDFK